MFVLSKMKKWHLEMKSRRHDQLVDLLMRKITHRQDLNLMTFKNFPNNTNALIEVFRGLQFINVFFEIEIKTNQYVSKASPNLILLFKSFPFSSFDTLGFFLGVFFGGGAAGLPPPTLRFFGLAY